MKKVLGLIAIVGFVACNSATDAANKVDTAVNATVDTAAKALETAVDTNKAKVEGAIDTAAKAVETKAAEVKGAVENAVKH